MKVPVCMDVCVCVFEKESSGFCVLLVMERKDERARSILPSYTSSSS